MRVIFDLMVTILLLYSTLYSQQPDSSKTGTDSTNIKNLPQKSLVIKDKNSQMLPTMPAIPTLSEKQGVINFDIRSQYLAREPEHATNFDAMNKPGSYKYESPYREPVSLPNIPITPLEVPEPPFYNPLHSRDYVLPTRQEVDILEVLWAKENVMDTTIYSCLDTAMNVTFEDLNKLMEGMAEKGLVSRRIVSPRNEFNVFGFLIEMSSTNLRNRIYEYRSNVDRELMKTFVDANAFLFSEDKSIVDLRQLRAAKKDSSLLRDLNVKLNQPKD